MTIIKLKRVYDDYSESDGFRILVDRLWPRGIKKESLHSDLWAKELTPSTELRKWYHLSMEENWDTFVASYRQELNNLPDINTYLDKIREYPIVTLLYASNDVERNHAMVLKEYLEAHL